MKGMVVPVINQASQIRTEGPEQDHQISWPHDDADRYAEISPATHDASSRDRENSV
jgi:hypothetical protein